MIKNRRKPLPFENNKYDLELLKDIFLQGNYIETDSLIELIHKTKEIFK